MRKTSEAWRNGQLLRRADRSFGVKALCRFRALKYPRKSGVAHLISFEDHHFAGCDESPFTVSLLTTSNPLPLIGASSFPSAPLTPVTVHEPSTVPTPCVIKRISSPY